MLHVKHSAPRIKTFVLSRQYDHLPMMRLTPIAQAVKIHLFNTIYPNGI